MYQDNKKQLIMCQVVYCIIFIAMGSLFAAMFAETHKDPGCELEDPSDDKNKRGSGCFF